MFRNTAACRIWWLAPKPPMPPGEAVTIAAGLPNLLAEADIFRRRVRVVVLVVERQAADIDYVAVEIVAADGADRPRHLPVDAAFAKAADEDRDLVGHCA